jgi:hypothetical protein
MNRIPENQLPGTDAWRITRPSILIPHQIEGFASATSVNIGETITFFVNCMAPSFSIDIFMSGICVYLGTIP